jgi:hypothetical protein
MPRKSVAYAATVAAAAPIIPNSGISVRLRTAFRAAATPVMISSSGRRAHPIPNDDDGHERGRSEAAVPHGSTDRTPRCQQLDEPGSQHAQRERHPRRDRHEVGEDERVRPRRLAVVLDRVGEGRPRCAEGREEQDDRGGDPDADRVEAHLSRPGEPDEEEAVAGFNQRKRPDGTSGIPNRFILQRSVPLEAEPLRRRGAARRDGERPGVDDDADRPRSHTPTTLALPRQ